MTTFMRYSRTSPYKSQGKPHSVDLRGGGPQTGEGEMRKTQSE